MNRKGFTMIEMLVVVAILGLLLVLTIPSIQSVSNNSRIKMCKSKLGIIENDVNAYLTSNSECFVSKNDSTCGICISSISGNECITNVERLVELGLVEYNNDKDEVINPKDKSVMNDYQIKIVFSNKRFLSNFIVDDNVDDNYNSICGYSDSSDEEEGD